VPRDHDSEATALLDTLAPDLARTLVDAPRRTIVPRALQTTGGARAMAMLAELSNKLTTGVTIGEGGMGVIRAAEQTSLGRTVAVKTLKPNRKDPAAALDLLREAWVTGSLEHPNIVPVHYLELDEDGSPIIVLKKIVGRAWSELFDEPSLVQLKFGTSDLTAWNLDVLLAVLNALRFAHSRGIVHRDLKPSNVMIGDFGEVYLLDWGIAVATVDDGSGRFALAEDATEPAGTPCYMAPEMLAGPITERTDVYLAGAVLHELVTGRPPHEGTSPVAVIAQIMTSDIALPEHVPPELAAICTRAMARDPDDRYPTIDALRLAVARYLEHRGSSTIAANAHAKLGELEALLAASSVDREAAYRVFGACRFGFHEALSVWAENADARAGLVRATSAIAEYELAHGTPDAAVAVLRDLEDAPAALVTRARTAAAEAAAKRAELEKLEQLHDLTTGKRTRVFIAGLVGIAFTVLPLLSVVFPERLRLMSHRGTFVWAAGALGVFAILIIWARDSMRATLFNRRLAATGAFVFVAQMLLSASGWLMDLPVATNQVFMMFLWSVISSLLAIHLDRWLAPCAIFYAAMFLVGAKSPELRFQAMSAGNFVFAVNAVIRWRPRTFRQTAEEREWLVAQKAKRRVEM